MSVPVALVELLSNRSSDEAELLMKNFLPHRDSVISPLLQSENRNLTNKKTMLAQGSININLGYDEKMLIKKSRQV